MSDEIADCWAWIRAYDLENDLTLQERYEANRGNLEKLKSLVEARPRHFAADAIGLFETLPEDAVLFWEDEFIQMHRDEAGKVYITESQSDKVTSSPSTESPSTESPIAEYERELLESVGLRTAENWDDDREVWDRARAQSPSDESEEEIDTLHELINSDQWESITITIKRRAA